LARHQMTRAVVIFTAAFLAFAPAAFGACPKVTREVFAQDLAKAYASNNLQVLDKKYPDIGSLQILIEHSISEEENGATFFDTYVPSFHALAKLLQSRQTEGLPRPEVRPLRECANGVCSFYFLNGIQHNTLYLKEIRYNDYSQCLEVETIWFLDGD
jgi:hypothetical protein